MDTLRTHHFAIRCKDRYAAAKFYCDFWGYVIDEEFTLFFDDEQKQTAQCISLRPVRHDYKGDEVVGETLAGAVLDVPPSIFISDGSPDSVVGDWVLAHGGGVHHIASQVDDVAAVMLDWQSKGIKFTSNVPFESDGLIQAFTVEDPNTGLVYELINNDAKGFRAENVKRLMESTKNMGRGAA